MQTPFSADSSKQSCTTPEEICENVSFLFPRMQVRRGLVQTPQSRPPSPAVRREERAACIYAQFFGLAFKASAHSGPKSGKGPCETIQDPKRISPQTPQAVDRVLKTKEARLIDDTSGQGDFAPSKPSRASGTWAITRICTAKTKSVDAIVDTLVG